MFIARKTFPNDPGSQTGHLFLARESVADRPGQQAGTVLLIVQLLARERLIKLADGRKLIRLLAADSPEAQRFISAQCVAQRKVRRDYSWAGCTLSCALHRSQ
jgi:hypothetical protein